MELKDLEEMFKMEQELDIPYRDRWYNKDFDKQELNETSENLNIFDVIERLIQDKSKEYVNEYKFDNMKEEGIAYSAFLAGCRYILLNKDKF